MLDAELLYARHERNYQPDIFMVEPFYRAGVERMGQRPRKTRQAGLPSLNAHFRSAEFLYVGCFNKSVQFSLQIIVEHSNGNGFDRRHRNNISKIAIPCNRDRNLVN